MASSFTSLEFWFIALGGLAAFRRLLILLSAEQGRKRDLVKRLVSGSVDFPVSILLPFREPEETEDLLVLLKTLDQQHYPTSKLSVHLACTPQTSLELEATKLAPYVKTWVYPKALPEEDTLRAWTLDRILATTSTSLVVFLKAGDVLKPDFLISMVSKAYEASVIQGYVANRLTSQSWTAQVAGLQGRLHHRLQLAGRYHAGLPVDLGDTGFAIRPDLLEKLPFQQGKKALSPKAYSMELYFRDVLPAWAPNVVVYRKTLVGFWPLIETPWQHLLERLQMMQQYAIPLLVNSIMRFRLGDIERLFSLILPNVTLTWMGLLLFGFLSSQGVAGVELISSGLWYSFALVTIVLQVLGLLIARCRASDVVAAFFWEPIQTIAAVGLSPMLLMRTLLRAKGRDSVAQRYKSKPMTRFNELLDQAEQDDGLAPAYQEAPLPPKKTPPAGLPVVDPTRSQSAIPLNTALSVPLTNGEKQVLCLLKTEEHPDSASLPQPTYRMTLEYKGQQFHSQYYKVLDQAFYELQAFLMDKGLSFLSCGSCGFFYNPSADKPSATDGGLQHKLGFCLFGKQGKPITWETDAITVLSQACHYHAPLEQRGQIVQAWLESQQQGSLTDDEQPIAADWEYS